MENTDVIVICLYINVSSKPEIRTNNSINCQCNHTRITYSPVRDAKFQSIRYFIDIDILQNSLIDINIDIFKKVHIDIDIFKNDHVDIDININIFQIVLIDIFIIALSILLSISIYQKMLINILPISIFSQKSVHILSIFQQQKNTQMSLMISILISLFLR